MLNFSPDFSPGEFRNKLLGNIAEQHCAGLELGSSGWGIKKIGVTRFLVFIFPCVVRFRTVYFPYRRPTRGIF